MKWKKSKYLYLTLISTFAFFYACEKASIVPEEVGNVSFSKDIKPIFSNSCVACHGGSISPDLRSDVAYNSLKNGAFYNTANPQESKLVKKLNESSHSARASEVEKQKILQWIKQGAKND